MTREESQQQALFEAAGWMARLTETAPSDRTKAEFRVWLTADPLHARAMERVEAQWRLSKDFSPLEPRRRFAVARPFPRIAGAAFAALLAVAFLLVRPLYGEARFATGIGEVRDVVLADGSQVHLDADSVLDMRYRPFTRGVVLSRGAAEFTVAHNVWRPFTVAAGAADIRVTGTHFLVRRDGGGASAYLISGGIELRDGRSGDLKAELRPGTEATISASGAVMVQANDGARDKAWLSGKLLFDHTALSDALDQFRHYGPVAVTLASDDLGALKISGLYSSGDLQGFLQGVATAYPLRLTTAAGGGLVIEKLPGKK